jgi:hypothetical protein
MLPSFGFDIVWPGLRLTAITVPGNCFSLARPSLRRMMPQSPRQCRFAVHRRLATPARRADVMMETGPRSSVDAGEDKRSDLLRELMAVFDDLPAALREAINYAPEPLNPKDLAVLCRRHGAANVLAMIELKLKRRARTATDTRAKSG